MSFLFFCLGFVFHFCVECEFQRVYRANRLIQVEIRKRVCFINNNHAALSEDAEGFWINCQHRPGDRTLKYGWLNRSVPFAIILRSVMTFHPI